MKMPHPMTLDELRSLGEVLDRTTACALPGCVGAVTFRTGVRGRRQRFCSGACRAKFSRERIRLHRLWARLDETAYRREPGTPTEEVDHLVDHVTWLLEGYGGVDKTLAYGGISPRPFASLEAAMNYSVQITADELATIGALVNRVTAFRGGETALVNPDDPPAPSSDNC